MKNIQNVIIALFVIFCAALPCFIARADTLTITETSNRTTGYDVTVVKGYTDFCVRIDANTLSCTRTQKGEKPTPVIVKK